MHWIWSIASAAVLFAAMLSFTSAWVAIAIWAAVLALVFILIYWSRRP